MANFILDKRANTTCTWQVDVDPPIDCCGRLISRVTLPITPQDSTGTGKLQVAAGGAVWEKKDIAPNELSFFREPGGDNHVLNLVSATGYCVSPPTIRLQALPTSLAGCSCVAAADIGCAPGGAAISTRLVPIPVSAPDACGISRVQPASATLEPGCGDGQDSVVSPLEELVAGGR